MVGHISPQTADIFQTPTGVGLFQKFLASDEIYTLKLISESLNLTQKISFIWINCQPKAQNRM
jgi:hypothetical protein